MVLLTTNTIKKGLRGAIGPGMSGVYETGMAINCLSNIVTEDLARELLNDVTNLTNHPQPYLRKKAILCLLKMFMKYPQGLRLTFDKIQQCLVRDSNPSVTSCAVNVITELSDKNPKNYLVLAPSFFALLTTSSNNWMLIKVVKLLGSLVAEEPRLARKLLEPLSEIVKKTQAKSLLYEAVYTITLSLPYCRKADGSMPASAPSIVALCAETLKSFVEEADQNLKYLGLVGFGSLMVSHPKVLSASDYRPLILACLSDEDVTIRTRALGLLVGVATRKNIMELVTQLLHHVDMASGTYKSDLVVKIIEICSGDKYTLIGDFAWYIDVLVILSRTRGIEQCGSNGANLELLVSGQVTDVTLRVLPVRAYSVRRMIGILLEGSKNNLDSDKNSAGNISPRIVTMSEVLRAAAWIVGEYAALIGEAVEMSHDMQGEDDDELTRYDLSSKGTYHAVIQALTDPSIVDSISLSTQAIYVQAAAKVFAAASSSIAISVAELEGCVSSLACHLPVFMQSMDTEVQERAFTFYHLLNSFNLMNSGSNMVPGLIQVDGSGDSSEDEDEIKPKIESATDDLLNLTGSGPSQTSTVSTAKKSLGDIAATSALGSISSKCKSASSSLQYLLIPEPMKPISGKAQKKKRQAAPDAIQKALGESFRFSVFSKLLEGDLDRVSSRGQTSRIESVTFTHQKRMHVPAPVPIRPTNNVMEGFGSENKSEANGQNDTLLNTNYQQPNLSSQQQKESSNPIGKTSDPFYLNSSNNELNKGDRANRFGTIQLLDSDGDDFVSKKLPDKKKKKKKDKKHKTNMEAADLAMFGGMNTSSKGETKVDLGIFDSDEDDDDGEKSIASQQFNDSTSKGRLKGFEGLAQIDLTTPLRDDEVMPKNEHRVVTEKREDGVERKKEKRKKAKSSKKGKKELKVQRDSGNLLDFGGLGAHVSKNTNVNGNRKSESKESINPINSAFDDLLGLESVAPVPPLQQNAGVSKSASKKSPKIWQECSIKSSRASGSDRLKWDRVSLRYRIQNTKKDEGSMMVSFKLMNNGGNVIQDVSMTLKEPKLTVGFPDALSGSSAEVKKVGPFTPVIDESHEVRGMLNISGSSIPVKIMLPVAFSLCPLNGLTHDDIPELLNSNSWFSHSVRISNLVVLDRSQVASSFQKFLKAGNVSNDADDESNHIFASQSTTGIRILFLLKIGTSDIKVDVKATDKAMGKAIASDLKKVLLD